MLSIFVAALCTQAVFASPTGGKTTASKKAVTTTTTTKKATPAPTCNAVQRNANFDDLTGVPGSELNPIPDPYMGLFFQGFDFVTVVQTNVAPGVVPHSGTK